MSEDLADEQGNGIVSAGGGLAAVRAADIGGGGGRGGGRRRGGGGGRGLVAGRGAPFAGGGVRFGQAPQFRPGGGGRGGLEGEGLRAVLAPPHELGAARGEPDPPVHGKETAVGQVEDPVGER